MSKNKNVMAEMMALVLSVTLLAGCADHITQAYADDLTAGTVESSEIIDEQDPVDEEDNGEEEKLIAEQQLFQEKVTAALPYLTAKNQDKLNGKLELAFAEDVTLEQLLILEEESQALIDRAATVKSYRQTYSDSVRKVYNNYKQYLSSKYRTKAKNKINVINSSFKIDKEWYKKQAKSAKKFIKTQGTKVKKARAAAKKKTRKAYRAYRKYMTPSQQAKAVKKMGKINKKYTDKDLKKIIDYVQKLADKGKAVKNARSTAFAAINQQYKTYKSFLTPSDIHYIKKCKKKISISFSVKDIQKYQSKVSIRIAKRYGIPGIDVSGWSVDKIKYVKEWGRKNNAFLAGSPMAGTGYYIARAAYETNIDPAALAAISRIESNCGRYCCGRYNAYGWIWPYAKSFSSWEDGINQWHSYFSQWFAGDSPLSSMHGYGGYGVGTIQPYLNAIRNA